MMSENCKKDHEINGVKLGFTDKKITSYGGFSMLAMFFKKVELKAALNQMIPIQETSPNAMKAEEKILGFMTTVIAGGRRFSHVMYLGNLEVIKSVFGLRRLPEAGTTLTRYFSKIKHLGDAEKLSEGIWKYLLKIIDWERINDDWLSFDSTVITRYGEQEGAKKGYNPSKKGRASHHPLLAFLNGSRIVLNIWNRSGNTSSKNNIMAFFESVYNRIVGLITIKGVLADSGFYDEEFIQSIEAKKLKYVITAKLYSTLQRAIYEHGDWQRVESGLWISEINFKHLDWEKSYRYVIVRQSIKKRKRALGKQLRLFELETESYRYGVWITNLTEHPLDVWRAIRQRSNDENTIKEFKEDLALSGFSMSQFYATEAAFLIRMLLYNLLLIFRTTFLPESEQTQRISTLRFKYFIIPAHLGRDASGKWLRLSVFSTKLRLKIQAVLDAISAYSIPKYQLHCS
jgi:hypothetical protein